MGSFREESEGVNGVIILQSQPSREMKNTMKLRSGFVRQKEKQGQLK